MFEQKQYYIRNKDVGTLVILNETLCKGITYGLDYPKIINTNPL